MNQYDRYKIVFFTSGIIIGDYFLIGILILSGAKNEMSPE